RRAAQAARSRGRGACSCRRVGSEDLDVSSDDRCGRRGARARAVPGGAAKEAATRAAARVLVRPGHREVDRFRSPRACRGALDRLGLKGMAQSIKITVARPEVSEAKSSSPSTLPALSGLKGSG